MSATSPSRMARIVAALRRALTRCPAPRSFAAVFDATLESLDPVTLRVRAFERAHSLAQPPHGAAECVPASTPHAGRPTSAPQ